MKRPLKITLIVSSVLLLAILVLVANVTRSHMRVRGIEVEIDYGNTPQLVNQKVVADTLMGRIPDLMQKQVRQVDCRQVAKEALHVPFLTHVHCGKLYLHKAIVRNNCFLNIFLNHLFDMAFR